MSLNLFSNLVEYLLSTNKKPFLSLPFAFENKTDVTTNSNIEIDRLFEDLKYNLLPTNISSKRNRLFCNIF